MSDIFRILERLKIAGKGPVYVLKDYFHSDIRIGDVLYDLHGNRFKVKCFEMFRRTLDGIRIEDLPLGIMFELMDGVEPEGDFLVRDLENVNFLFCSHPLYPKRVDEDYEEEYQAAGLEHACALFSYEDLELGKLSLYGEDISGLTIYRGWMMKPAMYRTFYEKLEAKGIILINSPEEYERYHMLPGWYDDFKDDTAKSLWEDRGTVESALKMARDLEGSYIVKDFVKSRKHEWYDACYIKNIADKVNAERVIRNFIERQYTDLVGGVVLRQFEKLNPIGFHEKSGMPISEEYRVFVFAGRIMIIDDYWQADQDISFSDEEWIWLESLVKKLKSNFVTIDLARRVDERLIIMELGDGQVSGIQQIRPADFYRAFSSDFIRKGEITAEKIFPEGTVILAGDPMPDMSIEEMRQIIALISTTQDLVDVYVAVHNKFWFVEDELYDYDKGTEEYERVLSVVSAWDDIMEALDKRIMETAAEEGLLAERQPDSGTVKQLEAFMDKYGYRNGSGWWLKKKGVDG